MDIGAQNQAHGGGYNYLPATEENGPLAKYNLGEVVQKTVRIMGCIYAGEQGYAVYDAEEEDRRFTISGAFPYKLSMNAFYQISGEVMLDKRGIRQIKVSECRATLPTDQQGIINVLQTLHGLDTQAHKLFSVVGSSVLTIMKTEPERIASMVKGVGLKRAKMWQAELLAMDSNDNELQKLLSLSLNQKQATKLVSEYGLCVCDEAKQNPYILINRVRGFGFKKCDKLALCEGISIRSGARIRAGLLYLLNAIEEKGHCTYPYKTYIEAAHVLLDVSLSLKSAKQIIHTAKSGSTINGTWGKEEYIIKVDDLRKAVDEWEKLPHARGALFRFTIDAIDDTLIEAVIQDLQSCERLVLEEYGEQRYITPGVFFRAEANISAGIRDIVANERLPFEGVNSVVREIIMEMGIVLEEKQLLAVERICKAEGGAFVLNGSAGCGKTFTLNIIVQVLIRLYREQRNFEFNPCILAPTGKAAKVASKSTGLPAQTIHRALGLISKDSVPALSSGSVISNNCIVVDEFSMVDEILCSQLLSGIPKSAKVIFLGDTEQSPSIRAGRVLRDLIDSGQIPVLTLDVVKRQSAQSGVLVNANKILNGESIADVIVNDFGLDGNAYVHLCNDPFIAQTRIIKMSRNCGLSMFQSGDLQVLCPLKAGPTGVEALNYYLQQELNPAVPGQEVVVGRGYLKLQNGREEAITQSFRTGDCVIHTKNNYDLPWYQKHPVNGFIEISKSGVVNGDTGIVSAISIYKDGAGQSHRVVYVRYNDHYIAYDNDFEELALAYALTIHKSQGSQWPIVICPIVQPTYLLNRKLLYTMYTRASSTSILVGRKDLIDDAIRNDRDDMRLTLLKERLGAKMVEMQ